MNDDQPLPVWLDCDPGHDDALAIMLAAFDSRLRLLGVSTVHGNQTLAKTTTNAHRVLAMAGITGVRVVAGAARPLLRAPRICSEIHGASGLDGPDVAVHAACADEAPETEAAIVRMHAALSAAHATWCESAHAKLERVLLCTTHSFLPRADVTRATRSGRATLVCTGALTNAALLLSVFPDLTPKVRVVLMGGALGAGNTGAVAEFNMQIDPEAAAIVFNCGADVTMVPLEVTHTALVTPDVLARIRGTGSGATRFRHVVCELLLYFAASYKRVFAFEAPPLHDPCAVCCALAPQLFTLRRMRVDVETCSPLCAGQTVCDVWCHSSLPPNVNVATAMDAPAFWELMLAALDCADARSPLNASVPAAG
jgi:inosine-uridine nucleoside N-ribohydrolase